MPLAPIARWMRRECLMILALTINVPAVAQDIDRAQVGNFTLGDTTKAQILEKLGEPDEDKAVDTARDIFGIKMETAAGVTRLKYFHSEAGDEQNAVIPNIRPQRYAFLYFIEDRLVAYRTGSSFKSDSTDFELAKAFVFIRRGITTEQDVMALFGPPSGRGNYPISPDKKLRSMFYEVDLWNHPTLAITRKRMRFDINAEGKVEDFSATATADPIRMYIPHVHR